MKCRHTATPETADAPETFEQDADDVAALLKQLDIPKASIFGFSNGGNTAMQIGIRHPGVVNKLIVASAFYKREGMIPGFFENMQHASLENMPEPLKEAFLKINPDTNKLRNMHDKDKARMLAFKDWNDDDLYAIQAPAFIIAGNHDVVTTEHTVLMSQLIPHSELMILPGTHGSFIGEVCSITKDSKIPELTVAAVEEFLDK